MIKINITHIGDYLSCEFNGHANYEAKGKDIVCASVSVLSQYVSHALSLITSTHTILDEENALLSFKCYVKEEHEKWIEAFIDFVLAISAQFPDNIKLTIKTDE